MLFRSLRKSEEVMAESIKLSDVLRKYENKLRQEIAEKEQIIENKANEVNQVHREITHIEDIITNLQNEKTRLLNSYLEKIRRCESEIENRKRLLSIKRDEYEFSRKVNNGDDMNAHRIRDDIKLIDNDILKIQRVMNELLERVKDKKKEISIIENNKTINKERYDNSISDRKSVV